MLVTGSLKRLISNLNDEKKSQPDNAGKELPVAELLLERL